MASERYETDFTKTLKRLSKDVLFLLEECDKLRSEYGKLEETLQAKTEEAEIWRLKYYEISAMNDQRARHERLLMTQLLSEKQERLRKTEEYKAAVAEMKNELGKSHIRLDTIAQCILHLPTFDLQYAAFQQITTLLTGTPWSEKAAEVLETMFKKLQEQQDRQEAKQDRVIDTLKKGVKEGVTIVNAQVYNKKVQQQDYHVATPRMDHQEPKELTDGR